MLFLPCREMMIMRLSIIMLATMSGVVKMSGNPDEVTSLPGLKEKINFKHYSGYLKASEGKRLHYWFVESQHSPHSDPVVLWLNGGPACSSLEGLLNELGPFYIKSDGKTLYLNKFSWNKVANVIFLEAPAGVGFSYSPSKNYTTNDNITAHDNYLALQSFFVKFPQFKENEFYITGESYAGIYIPTLSLLLLNGAADINFKGFAIGNGDLDDYKLANSVIFIYYYHGLFGKELWDSLVKYCCKGCPTLESCNFANPTGDDCINALIEADNTASYVYAYNIYENCDKESTSSSFSRYALRRKYLAKRFAWKNQGISPDCTEMERITTYLTQKSVRKALHIPDVVPEWEICAYFRYDELYDTMKPQILELINSGKLRGLIYNGDVDTVCDFLGDEWFVADLGLKVMEKYRPWNATDIQISGFVKTYERLTFLTILGSGHMVPEDKPKPSLYMISKFLKNEPY